MSKLFKEEKELLQEILDTKFGDLTFNQLSLYAILTGIKIEVIQGSEDFHSIKEKRLKDINMVDLLEYASDTSNVVTFCVTNKNESGLYFP